MTVRFLNELKRQRRAVAGFCATVVCSPGLGRRRRQVSRYQPDDLKRACIDDRLVPGVAEGLHRVGAALGALNAPQGAAIPESHRSAEPLRTLPYRRAS